jgi:hypothetical protein
MGGDRAFLLMPPSYPLGTLPSRRYACINSLRRAPHGEQRESGRWRRERHEGTED